MFRKLLLLVVVIVIAKAVMNNDAKVPNEEATSDVAVATMLSTPEAEAAQASPVRTAPESMVSRWQYLTPTDTISGKAYKIARVISDNSLHLDFPYNGSNHGTLSVRQHPQYGLDVIISVEKGQILCPGDDYWTCVFTIRFDDSEPEKFTMKKAADGSSTVMFAAYPDWAIKKLKAARQVVVQLLMFKEGDQVLTFNVAEPLDW